MDYKELIERNRKIATECVRLHHIDKAIETLDGIINNAAKDAQGLCSYPNGFTVRVPAFGDAEIRYDELIDRILNPKEELTDYKDNEDVHLTVLATVAGDSITETVSAAKVLSNLRIAAEHNRAHVEDKRNQVNGVLKDLLDDGKIENLSLTDVIIARGAFTLLKEIYLNDVHFEAYLFLLDMGDTEIEAKIKAAKDFTVNGVWKIHFPYWKE